MDFVSTHNAREMYSRALWTIGFAAILYFINRAEYPGPAARVGVVILLIGIGFGAIGYGLNWFATEGQSRVQEQILDSLQLQGSERILCLSHELGIEVAKRLKSGKVISIGTTESNEAARETAKQAGLGDKIRFESGYLNTKLSYPTANFDIVLSTQALAGLEPAKAVAELVRVLKSGGRLILHEMGDVSVYRQQLVESQMSDIADSSPALPFGFGGTIVSARKSA